MRVLGRSLFAVCIAAASLAANAIELPETAIAYAIEVTLDPATRDLAGRETIRWTNPSATIQLDALPLHLYLNGFAHEDTSFARGAPDFLDLDAVIRRHDEPWGWTEPRAIRQNGVDLAWGPIAPDDGNAFDRSLIEVRLAKPLAPADTVELEIEFDARLPVPIARTGGYGDFFFVAQWFPKLAVFETAGVRGAAEDGFAAHQFHGLTEFYADYADFDVRIGLPPGWKVVATGAGGPEPEAAAEDVVWHRYRQRAVHDFAFAAGTRMIDVVTTHEPQGPGSAVEIHLFLPETNVHQAPRWIAATTGSLDVMGARVGPYPYATLSVVLPPAWAGAVNGMEYPTLFTGGAGDGLSDTWLLGGIRQGEITIAHEFAHQYFHGLVGTNEFEEAFMDEGLTEYWGNQIMLDTYGTSGGAGQALGRALDVQDVERLQLPGADVQPLPVWSGPSFRMRHSANFAQFYGVPAATLATASNLFGRETVDAVFAAYVERWAFRHPDFTDFLAVARDVGGEPLADFILEAFTQNRLPDYRVRSMSSEVWSRPRGRLVTADGVLEPESERQELDEEGLDEDEDTEFAGLDPAAREDDGRVLVERIDAGWTRRDERRPASQERYRVTPEPGAADDGWEFEEDTFHVSTARLESAGWEHAPVDVLFRFADGATLRETWDGRAEYRVYRFLRAAPLAEIRIDPEERIVLDPDRANNGRLREPDEALSRDWSTWLGALFQLLLEGGSQWL